LGLLEYGKKGEKKEEPGIRITKKNLEDIFNLVTMGRKYRFRKISGGSLGQRKIAKMMRYARSDGGVENESV